MEKRKRLLQSPLVVSASRVVVHRMFGILVLSIVVIEVCAAAIPGSGSDQGEASTVDGQHWHPRSSKWWMQHLSETSSWTVKPNLNGVKGAYLASDSATFACLLLLQNVCHVETEGHRPGAWYSPSGQDLSQLVSQEDVCGHQGRRFPPEVPTSAYQSHIFRIQQRQGLLLASKPKEKSESRVTWLPRGVVSPHDSYMGHLVERIGSMAEMTEALRRTLGSPHGAFPLPNITMLFGTSEEGTVSDFATNMSVIFFGRETQVVVGQKRPQQTHVCFQEALFTLNSVYTRPSAAALRERIYARADEELGLQGLKVQQTYQVSWAWRSVGRRIVNRGEVATALMEHFRGVPVELVEHVNTDRWEATIDSWST